MNAAARPANTTPEKVGNDRKTAESLANFSKLCGNPSCVTVSGVF